MKEVYKKDCVEVVFYDREFEVNIGDDYNISYHQNVSEWELKEHKGALLENGFIKFE